MTSQERETIIKVLTMTALHDYMQNGRDGDSIYLTEFFSKGGYTLFTDAELQAEYEELMVGGAT